MLFTETNPAWSSFSCMGTSILPRLSIKHYRQLVSVQNLRHCLLFHVHSTLADVLFNLRIDYDCLKLNSGNATVTMVARAYNGNTKYATTSLKQTAQTAMGLHPRILEMTRDVAYVEDAVSCSKYPK